MTDPSPRGQFWLHGFPVPGVAERAAVRAEELGFDGMLLADSQNLVGDVFVELGTLARATTRLGLGTGIVNPLTRHPAVTAGAIATVHAESGGRAVLGVGRGDSSLASIGLPPPSTSQLRRFVIDVRAYLHGASVDSGAASSRLAWLPVDALGPVPVELAATGPVTVRAGAVLADRVMVTVGADTARIASAVAIARQARADAGLDPAGLRIGAYVNLGCAPDLGAARALVRGSAAMFARFSAHERSTGGGLTVEDAAVAHAVDDDYDLARHGLSDSTQTTALDDAFIDRFAVVGDPARCAERFAELVALGLDRIVLVPGSRDSDPHVLDATIERFADEALPMLRTA